MFFLKDLIVELKTTNPQAYEQWKSQESIFELQSNEKIYFDLIKSGINYTQVDGKNEYSFIFRNIHLMYKNVN